MTKFLKQMLTAVINDALMPTGKNLIPTLFFAVLIMVVNVICGLFEIGRAFSFGGCLCAVVVLLMLLIIERSEYSAVSKLYRNVELRVKDIKTRQQAVSARRKDGRTSGVREKHRGSVQGGASAGCEDEDDIDGFDGSDSISEEQFGGDTDIDGYDEDDTG